MFLRDVLEFVAYADSEEVDDQLLPHVWPVTLPGIVEVESSVEYERFAGQVLTKLCQHLSDSLDTFSGTV